MKLTPPLPTNRIVTDSFLAHNLIEMGQFQAFLDQYAFFYQLTPISVLGFISGIYILGVLISSYAGDT